MAQQAVQAVQDTVEITRQGQCDREECGGAAVCKLEHSPLCLSHFIEACYERLDGCGEKWAAGNAGAVDRFLCECSQQAVTLLLLSDALSNMERARLFDIMLWANELVDARRHPRLPRALRQ